MSLGRSQSALPAELMRGLRFAQDFWDKASVLRDAWTLTSYPALDNGITVDGVNQKAEWSGVIRDVQSVSFWVTLGSTTEDILQLSAAHSIEANAGTLTATGWAAPTIMVNGVVTAVITTARSFVTVTTATPFDADDIAVGEVAAFGDFKKEALKIWAAGCVLSLQEALDSANNATWDWRNLLTYDLEFNTGAYDPVNNRTCDARTESLYAVLGNGAGVGEPTQAKGHMVFDGVNDYLSGIANPVGNFTVMGMKDIGTGWEFFSHNDLTEWTPIFTSGGFTGKLTALMLAPSVLTPTQELDAERAIWTSLGHQL